MRNNMGVEEWKTRWAIINVWRPIRPIRRDPFGMCDAKTVAEEDLVQVEAVLPPQGSGTFENVSKGGFSTWCCKSNPNHRWYCKCHLSHCLLVWAGGWGRGRTSTVPESGEIRPHSVHNGISIESDSASPRATRTSTLPLAIEDRASNVVGALTDIKAEHLNDPSRRPQQLEDNFAVLGDVVQQLVPTQKPPSTFMFDSPATVMKRNKTSTVQNYGHAGWARRTRRSSKDQLARKTEDC